jgi:biotin-(acetyl-CoA carboxylase) ligase
VRGRATGIDSDGQLVVTSPDGVVTRHRTGSLTFADSLPISCS